MKKVCQTRKERNKKLIQKGSVRVDLLGGTLDLHPINLILKNALTLNLASSLEAKVILEKTSKKGITIHSLDYNLEKTFQEGDSDYGPLSFVLKIIRLFGIQSHLKVTLSSQAPAGAGLGGSSSMGATIFKALCKWTGKKLNPLDAARIVCNIESMILSSGPAGYQDYYPALYGGILALIPSFDKIKVEQVYSLKLKNYLEDHISLIYSGCPRFSGMNNWEVYKNFFDKDEKTVMGLQTIADLSYKAYLAILERDYDNLIELIKEEGRAREKLFPNIVSQEIRDFYDELLKSLPHLGFKVCGAGGGGCFLLIHKKKDKESILNFVNRTNMKVLEFKVLSPLKSSKGL